MDFLKKCSTSVLMVYAITIFLLLIILFIDENIGSDRIITAINMGNIFIITGELLCSPFVLSSSLRRTYNIFAKICKITNTTLSWIENKKNEVTKKANLHATNENAEKVLHYFGSILIMLGFSFFLLIFMSDKFYFWILPISKKLATAIISFFFLMVYMIIKEHGEDSQKKVAEEIEISLQLQQGENNEGKE